MSNNIVIERLTSLETSIEELASVLVQVVEDGASVGFLPPLSQEEAIRYWRSVPDPEVLLFVARLDGRIAAAVQLQLCGKSNGSHRVEIAKLMTHPQCRRRGIARKLMLAAEEAALEENRSLLVLDTREGDPSNLLYASLGYQLAGRIPGFARSADGSLDATMIYYKNIGR
ncbi:GNAT family N-acetyltransferase [Paenibacillus sp. BK720]|uniref:GNAT family N-acetyltransferase n=1 Tax=Paenibacillus sp. BK720 TaxID=2587092 RepID=UPI001421335E|nr:GNAT family N-acetyltransferase [Paenibacillus sp. BK720]NIK69062.1 ribosomal protein S18 acetylase RimI-like enzyme [Paenibacillus sp. BK720]